VPETKGITLEEMEFNLKNGVRLRDLGNRVTGQAKLGATPPPAQKNCKTSL